MIPAVAWTSSPAPVSLPAASSLLGSAGTSSTPPALLAHIDRLEQSIATFDLAAARRKATFVQAGTIMASGLIGQLCKALLPPGAALGVAAAMSLGVTCVGLVATNHVMHGQRDKSMFMGVGVMSFMTAFAEAGAVKGHPLLIAAATAGFALGIGALFAYTSDTCHFDAEHRIGRAREVAQKLATYQQQHAAVLEFIEPTQPAADSPTPA